MSSAIIIPFPQQRVVAPKVDPGTAVRLREMCRDLYNDAKMALIPYINEWRKRIWFSRGVQWGYDPYSGTFTDPAFSGDEEQETYNLMRTYLRTFQAQMMAYAPNPEVMTPSSDPESLDRAIAIQQLCRAWQRSGVFDYQEMERTLWMAATISCGWTKTVFDPNKGKAKREWLWRANPETGEWEAMKDMLGEQQFRLITEGEIDMEARDPFSVFPDPGAVRVKRLGYVVERSMVSLWKASEEFPVDYIGQPTAGRFKPASAQFDEFNLQTNTLLPLQWQAPGQRSERNRQVEILRMYMLPTRDFPDGLFLCWSDDLILAVGPMGMFPFTFLAGPNRDGLSLFPDGLAADMIPLQQTYNLNLTRAREHVMAFAPGILIPRGSGFSERDMSNIPGWAAEYNPGYEPKPFQHARLMPETFNLRDVIKEDMREMMYMSDAALGQYPNASGIALEMMQDQDAKLRSPEVQNIRIYMRDIWLKMIRLGKMYYPEGRMVKFFGENDAWREAPLRKDAVDWDVDIVIEPMGSMPQSKAIQDDKVFRALQYQALGADPERAGAMAREMLGWNRIDRNIYDSVESARSMARMENRKWRDLGPSSELEVVMAEDHQTHIEEHNRERASVFYKAQPPEMRTVIDWHVWQHEQAQQEIMYKMAMQAMMLNGGGGVAPGAAPPGENPFNGNPLQMGGGPLGLPAPEGAQADEPEAAPEPTEPATE